MHSEKPELKEAVIVVLVSAFLLILTHLFVWSQMPNINENVAESLHEEYVEKHQNHHP